ncbi:hypothetical protein [Legionella saoudiensis]|uniref:hypothetical protein n=1 Tax=Legionella saoudiensis TaxID=1750561 RepID=UPI000730595C|nr:hypothetical protein [Legionella saoudiensis]
MPKLNSAQKKLIADVVHIFFDELLSYNPSTSLVNQALQSLSKPILSFTEINYFQTANIWTALYRIRSILAHPCPQNPTIDVLPEELAALNIMDNFPRILQRIKDNESELEPRELKVKILWEQNYKVGEYIKFYLQHRNENNVIIYKGLWNYQILEKGLLNLTPFDREHYPISKQDLIKYLFVLIGEKYQQLYCQNLPHPTVYASHGAIKAEPFAEEGVPVLHKWASSEHFLKKVFTNEDGTYATYTDKTYKIYGISLFHIEDDKLGFILENNPEFYELLIETLAPYKSKDLISASKTSIFLRAISTSELPVFLEKLIEIEPSISLLQPTIMAKAQQSFIYSSYPWQTSLGTRQRGKGAAELSYRNLQFFITEMQLFFKKEGGISFDLKFNGIYTHTFGICLKNLSYPLPWFYKTSTGNYIIDLANINLLNDFLDTLHLLGLFDDEMLHDLKITSELYLKSLLSLNGWHKKGDFNEDFSSGALLNRQVIYTNLSRSGKIKKLDLRSYKDGDVTLVIDICSDVKNNWLLLLQAHNFHASRLGDNYFSISDHSYLKAFLKLLQQNDSTVTNELIDDLLQGYANTNLDRKEQTFFYHYAESQSALFFSKATEKIAAKESKRSKLNEMSNDPTVEENGEFAQKQLDHASYKQ